MSRSSMRRGYVGAVRQVRHAAATTGALGWLDHRTDRVSRHLRSLFAIHDVVDMTALGVPWWTYSAAAAVDRLLRRTVEPRVFEYGSGASTAWLAERAAEVISVEHDRGFAQLMRPLLPGNARLIQIDAPESEHPTVPSQRQGEQHREFAGYVCAIDDAPGEFDLVVVDGRARIACVEAALPRLARGGVVLLDDAWRREYRTGLARLPVRVFRFPGAAPSLPYPSLTALLRPTQP